jgi:hypothetical protein
MTMTDAELRLFQDMRSALNRLANATEQLFFLTNMINAPTAIHVGKKAVTTAGTPERLISSPLMCMGLIITANLENTGQIAWGSELVKAAITSHNNVGGFLIQAQSTPFIPINDVSKIWIDAVNSGDGVSYVYLYKAFEDKNTLLGGLLP